MEITFFSDTHGKHRALGYAPFVSADLVIFCGDMCGKTTPYTRKGRQECEDFLEWFTKIPVRNKVFIAGNHDFFFEDGNLHTELFDDSLHYLEHESIEIEGVKIWGSPVTPPFR